MPNLGVTFEAKFDGRCKACDLAVYEGDLMGWVDDEAVCDGCYNDAESENWREVRANIRQQQEEDRAKDPEAYDRRMAGIKKWTDSVRAKMEQEPGKDWVTSPAGTGYVNTTHLQEEDAPMAVEPGIQALMAAGLLQGQEPGGSGVCEATITDASGKVTEVAIPVPTVEEAPAAEVPATASVGDAAAHALARVRAAQLEANAQDWDPAVIAAEVTVAAQPDALQAGLQAAVDAGSMSPNQAVALGWVAPGTYEAPWLAVSTSPVIPDLFHAAITNAPTPEAADKAVEALDNLAPYGGPITHEAAKASILAVIEDAITNHPRSLQKSIGPSEIGTECDHCLAAKLAGWDQVREGSAWLPTVGTAVHTWLEREAFTRAMFDAFNRPRYLMERRVAVGTIDGVEITGSTDLVDVVAGRTWDWKIVGATTLKSAKVSPSKRYIVQQMLYALGWRRLGILITDVGIAYLPRNDVSLRKAVFWSAPFDEAIALEALARADAMARNLRALREAIGEDAVTSYVSGLPRWRSWRTNVDGIEKLVYGNAQEGKIECLDCARYSDYPEDPDVAMKQLEGIL